MPKKMLILIAFLVALASAQTSWNQSVLEDFTCMCIYHELGNADDVNDGHAVYDACYAKLIEKGPVDEDTLDRFDQHFMDVFEEMYFAYYVDNFE